MINKRRGFIILSLVLTMLCLVVIGLCIFQFLAEPDTISQRLFNMILIFIIYFIIKNVVWNVK